ncbi:MAG: tetratricopeptide repeat protein [Nitrososphaerota archaeon]|nr:tetratricopeptide repeat protein [Nitrososphaerota archaeon]
MEPYEVRTPSGLPYFLDTLPFGAEPLEEGLLSLDRTYAILAAMWDKRNRAEKKLDPQSFRRWDDSIGWSLVFNLRNSTDTGFHRLVNRETDYLNGSNPKGNVVREHVIVLTKFIPLDNLRLALNEYSSFDEMEQARKEEISSVESKYKGAVPGLKQLKRFVDDYYPEMVGIPLKLHRRSPSDGRFRLFETAMTKQETELHLRKSQEMFSYYSPDFMTDLAPAVGHASEVAMLLRTYDPDDLAKLARYREDVERIIQNLSADLVGPDRPSHWMVEQFKTYRFTVKPLFEELRWYVELKWFQRRPKKSQMAMLKTKTRFDYTADDAKKAVRLSSLWFEDDPFVFRQVLPVSWAFQQVGKPEASALLYHECQIQLKLPEAERILCLENIAHVDRWQGRTMEAISGLEEALRRWEKVGPGQIASWIIDNSWLAALYNKKGEVETSRRHLEKLVSLLSEFESKATPAYQAHIFLGLADTAAAYGDH